MPPAYVNLGLVDITLQRYPEAEKALRKAIEVNPKLPLAYANLANYYRLQKQLPQAEQRTAARRGEQSGCLAAVFSLGGSSEIGEKERRGGGGAAESGSAEGQYAGSGDRARQLLFQAQEPERAIKIYQGAIAANEKDAELKNRLDRPLPHYQQGRRSQAAQR